MRDWNLGSKDLVIQRKTYIMNEYRLSVTNPETIVQLLGQSSIIYAIMRGKGNVNCLGLRVQSEGILEVRFNSKFRIPELETEAAVKRMKSVGTGKM